jgi:hypothetical protein
MCDDECRSRFNVSGRPARSQSRDARRRRRSVADVDELGVALCHELGHADLSPDGRKRGVSRRAAAGRRLLVCTRSSDVGSADRVGASRLEERAGRRRGDDCSVPDKAVRRGDRSVRRTSSFVVTTSRSRMCLRNRWPSGVFAGGGAGRGPRSGCSRNSHIGSDEAQDGWSSRCPRRAHRAAWRACHATSRRGRRLAAIRGAGAALRTAGNHPNY